MYYPYNTCKLQLFQHCLGSPVAIPNSHPILFSPEWIHTPDHQVFQIIEFIIPLADLGPMEVRQPGSLFHNP